MNTNNDVTGDRITNALKGDTDKYREGWEAIFGSKDMKKHVEQITGDVPHTVVDEVDPFLVRYSTEYGKEEILGEHMSQERIDKLKTMSKGIDRYIEETRGMTPEERGYFTDEFVEVDIDTKDM